MSKSFIALAIGLVSVTTWACSSGSADPSVGTLEQRLETDPAAPACAHAICATGSGLSASCDPCATKLCAADPYCCATSWDATCVGEVTSICGQSCTAVPDAGGGGGECAHPVCATGGPLDAACTSCATSLCAQDPYCCSTAWDATCVGEVASICGPLCK